MKKQLFPLLSLLALSGCASLTDSNSLNQQKITIDKIDSRLGKIGYVSLTPTPSGLWLRGEVKRDKSGRGPVYGHLHIEILDESGAPLASTTTHHSKRNAKARRAIFSKQLDVKTADAKTVRITHHTERHHGC